jgi:hypothetical protein
MSGERGEATKDRILRIAAELFGVATDSSVAG